MDYKMQTKEETIEVNAQYYFSLNLNLMSMIGLKCNMTENVGRFYHRIPTFITNVCALMYQSMTVYYLVEAISAKNTSLSIQIISQLVSNIQCFTKGFFLAFGINKIQFILQEKQILWKKYPPNNNNHHTILGIAQQTLTFCKFYVVAIFSCVMSYDVPLAINIFMQYLKRESTNYTYDLSRRVILVKYPFEVTEISTYVILCLQEALFVFIQCIFWVNSDTLFAQVTTHIGLQFKILKCDIEAAFNRDDAKNKEILIELVNRHRELLRICMLIEDVFSPIIFCTVFLSSINICVNVIGVRETISEKAYLDTGIYFTMLLITLFQIFFFCIFAEKLTEETRSLADAVYNLNWTIKDYKLRVYINLIIMRAQKPFYCTAYGFFPIGHQKLTGIISTSYSYYMMLQTTDK
ncbi:odorant receptor 276 isoform X1 [Nasonia vitripennis]|uniref:Odorant receptor n=2 Tax=Nasonia vitripennis TaxID=7425 RepID=A0A7M7HH48_NASVI|nr:odorant receptor 276 isoform X1 [Nasonia vitripennis]XP_031789380.1 odorant receptor 276 isoform X1 [Nasonia vitripennis]